MQDREKGQFKVYRGQQVYINVTEIIIFSVSQQFDIYVDKRMTESRLKIEKNKLSQK